MTGGLPLLAVLLAAVTSLRLPAQARSASGEVARAAELFRESSAIARDLAPSERVTTLLRRIAAAQVRVDDHAGALATAAGLGPWRGEVRTSVMCRYLEGRRIDDAHRFAQDAPPGDRDWALAHLASQLASPPFRRDTTRRDTVDIAALTRRALDVAREVRLPQARTDALLSIARKQMYRKDTAGAVRSLLAARATLSDVRDAEYVTSRRVLIFSELGAAGRVDEALAAFRSLPPDRRLETVWYIRHWPSLGRERARDELRERASLLSDVRDPNARAYWADGIARGLREIGDSALADSLVARYPDVDATTGRASSTPHRRGVPRTAVEEADSLARAGAIDRALSAVAGMPDPERVGYRARAYLALLGAMPPSRSDTAHLTLQLALAEARDASLSERHRDDLFDHVAHSQLSLGVDSWVETLGRVRDVGVAERMLRRAAPSRSARERRTLYARVSNSAARDLATAALIESVVQNPKVTDDDLAWSAAVADSLSLPLARETAQIAFMFRSLRAGDTAAARSRLLPLLATHDTERPVTAHRPFHADDLLIQIVRVGGIDDALRWARSLPDPAARAAALLALGDSMLFWLDRSDLHSRLYPYDGCRDQF